MADNVTPKYVEKQTAKNTLADTDLLPVKDMTAKKMVKATLLAVANYIVTKLKVLTFDNLKTTNKTLPGAVNEHIEDKKNPHGTTIEQLSGVPNTRKVNGKALSSDINLTSSDVGADASGTASSAVSSHNTNVGAHNDIRLLIQELTERMTVYHDTDDTTLDQASEFLAYIKANRSLIESITTSKVSVDDIINDLATNVANKPLSAAQGVVIKKLIDALQSSVDELEDKDISSLEEQTSAADTDVFALETSGTVKKITFLNICNAIVAKLSSLTVSALDTTAKTLVGAINELNSTSQKLENKITQFYFHEGLKVVNSADCWNDTYGFAQFNRIKIEFVIQGYHSFFEFYTGNTDQAYSFTTGYYNDDGNNRLVTIRFTTAGRYLTNVKAMMKLGDSPWVDAISSVYISRIYAYQSL